MAKKVKITKGGQTVYPATVMDAVVHPDLRVDSSKLIGEVNVSKIYPTGGIDGTNKYTLETAIAKIPSSLRNVGLKCSFLDDGGMLQTWEFTGGAWDSGSFSQVGAGKLSELDDKKAMVSHGNKYIREMYLSGDGLDSSHTFILSRIARNNQTYKWAVYIKDINLEAEYYVGFSTFSSEPKYIDNVRLQGIANCYMSAIINWDEIEEGAYLNNINLPLTNVFSFERNPYIYSKNTSATVESLDKEIFGGLESSELSGNINMSSTFSLNFSPTLLESSDNRYRIEVISGQERIKPRTFLCLINGSYYTESNKNITYESDYSAILQVAEKDTPITAFYVQVGVPNQVSAGPVTVRVSNIGTNGIADEVESIKSDVAGMKSDVEEINEKIDSIGTEDYSFIPSLHICKNIYCVVGDKIQLYYNSFVHHIGDYSLNIVCNKGRNYKRYWEYTPTSSDVGTVTMTIQLLDIDGKVIEEKQVSIVTKEAVNKPSQTNVLFVGDSLMMLGQQPIEVSRRLKGTTGIATSPSPFALSNFYIKGRKMNADQSVGWEGTGGWTWNSYLLSTGNPGIRFTVSDITDIRPGTIYTIQGFTQKVEISEINTTESTVFGIYYGKGDIYNNPELLPQTGSLTTSGQGQKTINYTAAVIETFQPFWNYDTNQFDISSYVDKYLDGHVEYICILLGSNSIIGMNPYTGDITNVLNQAKELITKIHEQIPNAIICVGTEALKSQNGGIGTSYAASGVSGSYLIPSWNYKFHKLNDAYRTLEEDEVFSQYVKVIDLCAQTDSEYAFNYTEVDVNTRVTTDKERRGTDGVHPNNQGYWMMADAWFRALLCL